MMTKKSPREIPIACPKKEGKKWTISVQKLFIDKSSFCPIYIHEQAIRANSIRSHVYVDVTSIVEQGKPIEFPLSFPLSAVPLWKRPSLRRSGAGIAEYSPKQENSDYSDMRHYCAFPLALSVERKTFRATCKLTKKIASGKFPLNCRKTRRLCTRNCLQQQQPYQGSDLDCMITTVTANGNPFFATGSGPLCVAERNFAA